MMRNFLFTGSRLAALCFLTLLGGSSAALAARMPVVAKWGRFEKPFKSSVIYTNAVQQASLSVLFTSPLGNSFPVDGFWDGGKTWRIRFSPDQPGRWTFATTCSDAANRGLHQQTGDFLCTAATGPSRFRQHGPVRVARDHRHLEHSDATPFFWLADTVWSGPRMAQPKDWQFYALTRAYQGFSVAQWAVAPGEDAKRQSAWSGAPDRIAINPDFFKRLDARLDLLSHVGILSGIVPLLEMPAQTNAAAALPDDQAELLVRYVVARWGAEPVAWLLAFEGDGSARNVGRWKRIGQAVFGSRPHAPVILFPGQAHRLLDEFRDQQWVDVFGCQSVTDFTDDALKRMVAGPFATEWTKEPARPLIPFAPCENGLTPSGGKRFSADDVRHATYWSLLLTQPAGVSYCAQGVANWDMTAEPHDAQTKGTGLPLWHKALFMPGAKQMSHLSKYMDSIDFWKLRPQPKAIASQPGQLSPRRFIAAAGTEANDLSLVYVPEDRTLELFLDALPRSPLVNWFNPRTGNKHPSVAVVSASTCQFPTPDPGDWLLVIKAGK